MVTTKGIAPGPNLWDAPWAPYDPLAYMEEAKTVVVIRTSAPAIERVGAGRERTSRPAAAAAILEATGTTVDVSGRPEPSETVYPSDLDAYPSDEPATPSPPILTKRERRNARDRAIRAADHARRLEHGEPTYGPLPRG